MTRKFPKFNAHQVATCFNCEGDIGDYWSKSGHATGHGEFVASCEKCRMSTWYDLESSYAIEFAETDPEIAMLIIANEALTTNPQLTETTHVRH